MDSQNTNNLHQPEHVGRILATKSSSNEQMPPDNSWILEWLIELQAKILQTRNCYDITGVIKRWEVYLISQNFTKNQAKRAELWITRGDWSYKGKNSVLEGSDFFPTDEKIRDLLPASETILISVVEYNKHIRDYKLQGALEERAKARQNDTDATHKLLNDELQNLVNENIKLKNENTILKDKVMGVNSMANKTHLSKLKTDLQRTETALQSALDEAIALKETIFQMIKYPKLYNKLCTEYKTKNKQKNYRGNNHNNRNWS